MACSGRNGIGTGRLDMEDKKKEREERRDAPRHAHKNWCELNQGGIECDCT